MMQYFNFSYGDFEYFESKRAYEQECKLVTKERQHGWYLENKLRLRGVRRLRHLTVLYGLTPEEYQVILFRQNGLCAICKTNLIYLPQHRVNIDHNHVSGKVRGLLCNGCNTALGNLKENPVLFHRAVEYLGGVV